MRILIYHVRKGKRRNLINLVIHHFEDPIVQDTFLERLPEVMARLSGDLSIDENDEWYWQVDMNIWTKFEFERSMHDRHVLIANKMASGNRVKVLGNEAEIFMEITAE